MEVSYAPSFVRQYKVLSDSLKAEIREKIQSFRDEANHATLDVHKLRGRLDEQYSFRVNYRIRIVLWYTKSKPREAILVAVGDHDVYDR